MEPIGYGYLIKHIALEVLPPYKKSFASTRSIRSKEITADGEEEFVPARLCPPDTWQGHLLFAVRKEGINLQILKAFFLKISDLEITALIQTQMHSVYLRRIWFFYEFLTGKTLPLLAIKTGNYDHVLPPEQYFVLDDAHSERAKRQRLFNNLPGTVDLCPIVRLTKKIKAEIQKNFNSEISEILKKYPSELIYRASSFLYLKETKSSYAIERQTPTQQRIAAFMAVLQQAGHAKLSQQLLIQLQNSIVDERYVENSYRTDQVYVGQTLTPGHEIIHFVGAKPEDVPLFMAAWLKTAEKILLSDCNPIISAAVLSFAFVFIHPFDDGNGRIHRYLLHHILTQKGVNPDNIIFPVSAVLYKNIRLYDAMLESFSKKLLPLVDYSLAEDGTMTVHNSTADFYRYINFTNIAEKFFDVVEETVRNELVPELDYLIAWEHAREKMREIVDMPGKKVVQFILFTQQNNGNFPQRRRELFSELTDQEIQQLADIVKKEILLRTP